MTKGTLEIITGPMFAGKTSALLKKARSFSGEMVLIKPSFDTRYGICEIKTHDGVAAEAFNLTNTNEILDSQVIKEVTALLPSDELICDLGDLFKLFGDTTRMKILYSLFESELCVCAIAELLKMEQSAISHQLKILKEAKLVGCRRSGKQNIYYLADEHVRTIIGQGYEHLTESEE